MDLLCNGKISVSACIKLYKIELLRKVPFIEGLLYEDNPFFYQIISICNKVTVCEKILYHHRVSEGNITQTFSKVNFFDHIKAMDMVLDCIKDYYSDSDYRYIARHLDNWITTERIYHLHYKKILNQHENLNVKKEQRLLRENILSEVSKEKVSCFTIKTKMKFFIMKYIPDLYYPLYKVYHFIKAGD